MKPISNGQIWEIPREIDCHSVNVIYYCKTGASTCKFPRHIYDCGITNNFLKKSQFYRASNSYNSWRGRENASSRGWQALIFL